MAARSHDVERVGARAGSPLRRLAGLGAAGLFVAATVVTLLGVTVRGGDGRSVSCGSGWDVISGRSGWQRWWAQDLADPADAGLLVRTMHCVGAVNARIVLAGVLLLIALALLAAAEIYARRRRPVRTAARVGPGRLRLVGTVVSAVGVALLVGGLAALALVLANPDSLIFSYIDRPLALLLGIVLLLPTVLLVALGVLARSAAQAWGGGCDENSLAGSSAEAVDHDTR